MITAIYSNNVVLEFKVSGNGSVIGGNFRNGNERPRYFIYSKGLRPAEIEYLKRYVIPI